PREFRKTGKESLMRVLIAVLTLVVALGATADALAQKPELAEVDAWLVRDPQMSAQFAVADQLGYFKQEGLKVNIRWYIAGTDLPSMWGAGNIHLGTATATMVVPIAASGQTIYNIAPKGDIDAMAAWAPWTFRAVKEAGGRLYFTGSRSYIPGKEGPVDWVQVHAGVVASGKMLKENPNTLKAVLRATRKATDAINNDRNAAIEIVAREMKLDKDLAREIMTYNVYSMEMNPNIVKGMNDFVDFLYSLDRIKQKFPAEQVFYTKILEEVDPALVKWKSKTDVK